MNAILDDLKLALRSLWRTRLVTVLAIVTLALGIGATTAIFSVLDATLLKPPAYPQPDELVAVWGVMPSRDIDTWPASPDMVERYRREAGQIEDFAAAFGNQHIFKSRPDSRPQQITAAGMTWNLFQLLGVSPQLGRSFEPMDAAFNPDEVPAGVPPPQDTFNPPNAVMLSHAFWQQQFAADPGVVGRSVLLDNFPATVVGVMPADFQLLMPGAVPASPDVFEVLRVNTQANAGAGNVFLNVIGRLADGVTLQQAQDEMDAISGRLRAEDPIYRDNQFSNRLVPLQHELTNGIDDMLLVIAGIVALVLLIACANVANLLLVRALARSRDQAICSALGSSRWRMLRYALSEAGLVAAAGGLVGLGVAWLALPALIELQPLAIPQLDQVGIDLRVLAFTALVVTLTAVLAGVLPAMSHSQMNVAAKLRDRAGMDAGAATARWRNGLVVGEVALALAVLVAAGLMLQSFNSLRQSDPGFDAENVHTFNLVLPVERYPNAARQVEFQRQFKQRLDSVPQIESAGGVFPLPLSGAGFGSRYAPDMASFEDGSARQAQYRLVYPGYFTTLNTQLLAGRLLTQADQNLASNGVVINQALADRAWPGESPLGKRLYIRRGDRPEAAATEVVGVVAHQAVQDLREEAPEVVYFLSAFAGDIGFFTGVSWAVRSSAGPEQLRRSLEQALAALDADIPLTNFAALQEQVDQATAEMRFSSTLISLFALLALVLAVVGLYGVLAYRVRQRMPELGLRIAFGATAARIFSLVLGQGMLLVGIGLGLGVLLALWISRALREQLVGLSASDPLTYVAIMLLFAAVAAMACMLPAWRATRTDPAVTLRNE